MEFLLDDEHVGLADTIDGLASRADAIAANRAWADGDTAPGLALWSSLAELGVTGLLVDDGHGGAGAGAIEMVVAAEALGRHAVPGPVAETLAAVPAALRAAGRAAELSSLAAGGLATIAVAPWQPRVADPAVATVYVVADGTLATGAAGEPLATVDPSRTVAEVAAGESLGDGVDVDDVLNHGALATAAQLLGLGATMLDLAAEYAKARQQFGRPIGSFQAVKHHLADVAVALEMARPLVHGAALALDGAVPDDVDANREVSAAKVAASDAAYLAARGSLQVLGAIGYTVEHDLSLFLTKTQALQSSWGTPAAHRQRILETLR
ncbi:putative acyl-CoA dehydrogenase [Gordonia araii NBRC 100433]|uniref:Putative acyl-CoA dehydrogenase n=1 Tax=Gordonia araii NBRC 100433 TaxID=1073574 RepID=G7H345_9ACTN|nr:acyl-CoA dehydrogenase family protein [Gordonia araii]NNG96389.1 acyl-CoA dehydrogenase [Gordonia araii NBRC 100433]GAB10270.1 putative acyl-CoA dehydrogenase [Gordonia araii NBRC 100433]